jgi:hypothetical protein
MGFSMTSARDSHQYHSHYGRWPKEALRFSFRVCTVVSTGPGGWTLVCQIHTAVPAHPEYELR